MLTQGSHCVMRIVGFIEMPGQFDVSGVNTFEGGWSSAFSPPCPGSSQARLCPLSDAFTLQFGKGGTHLEEKSTQSCCGVYLVGQKQEIDLAVCQIVHDLDEMER